MTRSLGPTTPSTGDEEGLWVRSWALPGGRGYGVRANLGAVSWTMAPDRATSYASAFIAAATTAEHDTAVFRLLTDRLGIPEATAAQVILRDLRPDRADRHEVTEPLHLAPAVGTRGPFIAMTLDGRQVGELTPADARSHAVDVLDTLAAADLDAALRRTLVGPIGLDEARASAVIASLGEHWPAAGRPRRDGARA